MATPISKSGAKSGTSLPDQGRIALIKKASRVGTYLVQELNIKDEGFYKNFAEKHELKYEHSSSPLKMRACKVMKDFYEKQAVDGANVLAALGIELALCNLIPADKVKEFILLESEQPVKTEEPKAEGTSTPISTPMSAPIAAPMPTPVPTAVTSPASVSKTESDVVKDSHQNIPLNKCFLNGESALIKNIKGTLESDKFLKRMANSLGLRTQYNHCSNSRMELEEILETMISEWSPKSDCRYPYTVEGFCELLTDLELSELATQFEEMVVQDEELQESMKRAGRIEKALRGAEDPGDLSKKTAKEIFDTPFGPEQLKEARRLFEKHAVKWELTSANPMELTGSTISTIQLLKGLEKQRQAVFDDWWTRKVSQNPKMRVTFGYYTFVMFTKSKLNEMWQAFMEKNKVPRSMLRKIANLAAPEAGRFATDVSKMQKYQ